PGGFHGHELRQPGVVRGAHRQAPSGAGTDWPRRAAGDRSRGRPTRAAGDGSEYRLAHRGTAEVPRVLGIGDHLTVAVNIPYRPELTVLDNGVSLLNAPSSSRNSAVFLIVRAGSRDETAETSGLAHYLEHMFFKGTE